MDSSNGFFDNYPRFYATSHVGSAPHRLNWRYRALIEANSAAVRGQRVLDLGSHDGRWSLAALRSGATRVTGIEARPRLVREAAGAMAEYGVEPDRYRFIVGDVGTVLGELPAGGFDTVLCLGFFYHTIAHMPLLLALRRLGARHVVMDTRVTTDATPLIELKDEDATHEANAAGTGRALVGIPSRPALELLLAHAGYGAIRYFDWTRQGIADWSALEEYRTHGRVSLLASRS